MSMSHKSPVLPSIPGISGDLHHNHRGPRQILLPDDLPLPVDQADVRVRPQVHPDRPRPLRLQPLPDVQLIPCGGLPHARRLLLVLLVDLEAVGVRLVVLGPPSPTVGQLDHAVAGAGAEHREEHQVNDAVDVSSLGTLKKNIHLYKFVYRYKSQWLKT